MSNTTTKSFSVNTGFSTSRGYGNLVRFLSSLGLKDSRMMYVKIIDLVHPFSRTDNNFIFSTHNLVIKPRPSNMFCLRLVLLLLKGNSSFY